jgi:alpha-galactosidase
VQVEHAGGQPVNLQSIRMLDTIGDVRVNLGGPENADRVLSDSYSEDRPPLHIFDLGKASVYLGEDEYGNDPSSLHLAVGSQLIYNRQSKYSLLLAALTSDRWLTIMHLETASPGTARISSYTADSTGTTEIMKKESICEDATSDQIELSTLLGPGKAIASERLAFSVSNQYHAQLETYGEAIRVLHQARIPGLLPGDGGAGQPTISGFRRELPLRMRSGWRNTCAIWDSIIFTSTKAGLMTTASS